MTCSHKKTQTLRLHRKMSQLSEMRTSSVASNLTTFSKAQRRLQREIEHRKTPATDLQTLKEIEMWSARHNGRLPIKSKDDTEQNLLSRKLSNLQGKKAKSPMLQKLLKELLARIAKTPTKAKARGGKIKDE